MINLQDTFNDSPSFRSEIVDTERLLSFIDEVVRNLVRAASAVSAAQETLRIAEEDLASWLRRLGTVEDSLEENLEEIARGISGLAGARESLTLQIGEAFLRPLDDYETTVVESTKKLGRDHVAAREAYEKALARYLEKPASTANDVSEAAADDVAETNYQRHKQALRYCRHLNDRESRQKYEVIDGLLVFLFSYTTFHHAAHEMLSEAKTGMDHLSRKVQLQTQQSADKPNDDQIESKYLSAAVSRYNPETSDFLQPTSPSTTQMAGYLYKRPIQTLRNAWSPWNRRWFVCDITSSTLYYIRPDGSDADKKSIDLRTAMVRVARDVDRRHCFEIVCPNRTYMLQAENKDAMKSWIDCLQKANARALFLHRPPEQRSGASAVVDRICSVAGNDRCADCGAVEPTWASISFGVTLCIECSGVHRNLGRVGQVSKIRSLTLDHWTPETVDMMVSLGNQKVNAVFEAL